MVIQVVIGDWSIAMSVVESPFLAVSGACQGYSRPDRSISAKLARTIVQSEILLPRKLVEDLQISWSPLLSYVGFCRDD